MELFKLSRIYHFNKSRLHYIGIILRTYSCVLFSLCFFFHIMAVLCDWYTGYIQWENNDLSFITVFVCEIRSAQKWYVILMSQSDFGKWGKHFLNLAETSVLYIIPWSVYIYVPIEYIKEQTQKQQPWNCT